MIPFVVSAAYVWIVNQAVTNNWLAAAVFIAAALAVVAAFSEEI
jgi:hypothetical protein